MSNVIHYVGLDVHKETIAVSIASLAGVNPTGWVKAEDSTLSLLRCWWLKDSLTRFNHPFAAP